MPLAPRIKRPQELQTLAPTGFRLTQYGHRAIIPVGISNHLKFSVRPYGTHAHSDSSKDATALTPVAIPVLCNLVHSCFMRGDNPEGSQTESALLCPHKINAGKQRRMGGYTTPYVSTKISNILNSIDLNAGLNRLPLRACHPCHEVIIASAQGTNRAKPIPSAIACKLNP